MTITRWNRLADVPLMAAAIAFLVAYAVPIIWPSIPPAAHWAFATVTWATWAVFAVDYLVRLSLAEHRGAYVRRHWIDLLIILLPLLRPLRVLRLAALLSVLNRRATHGLHGRIAVYVAGGSTLLAFCGALAVLDAERGAPEANLTSFGDAIWWSITTMTTVGYGDQYPVTGTGRLVAALLMLGGIALLGVVTATLASWLVEWVAEDAEESDDALLAEVRQLRAELQTRPCPTCPPAPAAASVPGGSGSSESQRGPTGGPPIRHRATGPTDRPDQA